MNWAGWGRDKQPRTLFSCTEDGAIALVKVVEAVYSYEWATYICERKRGRPATNSYDDVLLSLRFKMIGIE